MTPARTADVGIPSSLLLFVPRASSQELKFLPWHQPWVSCGCHKISAGVAACRPPGGFLNRLMKTRFLVRLTAKELRRLLV